MKRLILFCLPVATLAAAGVETLDYEPGTYANVRERAANTLRYAHSPNRMFEKIAAGKMSVGGYIGSRDPQVCEMAGMSGLDFVWIDMEHRAMTVSDLLMMQMALEGRAARRSCACDARTSTTSSQSLTSGSTASSFRRSRATRRR